MAKKFPTHPKYPERICWGCEKFCAAQDMRCGNGSERTPHPVELFGADWLGWGLSASAPAARTERPAEERPDQSASSEGTDE